MTKPDPSTANAAFVEDLFLTDSFLIKGRLLHKGRRLSEVLEDSNRMFLNITDATMVSLRGSEVIHAPSVMVNQAEILFAHEFLDVASDAELQRMAECRKTVRIRAFYSGNAQLEVAGNAEEGAYEMTNAASRRYFVVKDPVVRGIKMQTNPELDVLKDLGYLILRKNRMAYVYDFS